AGEVSRFLELPSGAPRAAILELVRNDLRPHVHAALADAHQRNRESIVTTTTGSSDGVCRELRVTARPLGGAVSPTPLFALAFQERELTESEAAGKPGGDAVDALEGELEITRRHLQTTIDDLNQANEDLRHANADQISLIEELHSANEELQLHREDLQSTTE